MLIFRNHAKKRRGATTLLEVVVCLFVATTIIIGFFNLSNFTLLSITRAQSTVSSAEECEAVVELMREEVRGAMRLEVSETAFVISRPGGNITYEYDSEYETIRRNSDPVLSGISDCNFLYVNADSVSVRIQTEDDSVSLRYLLRR